VTARAPSPPGSSRGKRDSAAAAGFLFAVDEAPDARPPVAPRSRGGPAPAPRAASVLAEAEAAAPRQLASPLAREGGAIAPAPPPIETAPAPPVRRADLAALRRRAAALEARADEATRRRARLARSEDETAAWLALAPRVESALDELSAAMFADVVGVLESALTDALRDVLGQPIALKVEQEWKRGGATMTFHVERDGAREDIMRGQGGSVANILSTGLRIFALARLDRSRHRPFLVLDEQDCWIRPDLVPRFVKLVSETGRRLGFQILMISHHDVGAFEDLADRIYRLVPEEGGVRAVRVDPHRDAE
jgi:hypothetical protein